MKEKYYEFKYKILKKEYEKLKEDKDTYKRLFQEYYSKWGRKEAYCEDLEKRYRKLVDFYENKE